LEQEQQTDKLTTAELPRYLSLAQLSTLSPYLSFVAMLLSLSFDVGYFTGSDINFYSFFSLSEHIMFAVQVLPSVLVGIFVGVFVFLPMLERSGNKIGENLNFIGNQGSLIAEKKSINFFLLKIYLYYSLILVSNLCVIGIVFIALLFRNKSKFEDWYIPGLVTYILLVSPFTAGYDNASASIYSSKKQHTILKVCQFCRVMRSGERGIMYVDSNSKLHFATWTQVQSISGN
jgi:hypothetical protein